MGYLYDLTRSGLLNESETLVFVQAMRGMEELAPRAASAPQTMEAVTHWLPAPPA